MTAEPETTEATVDLRTGWRTLASVVVGLFVVILDTTIVTVALPSLQETYGVTVSESQWVVSVYTLALGVATPLSGFLGERYGSKRMFLLALAAFGLASLACGLAPGFGWLIVARAVQGIAGGLAVPLATARLFTAFPAERRGLALGALSTVLVLAPVLGPLAGGWLVDLDATPWIFFVNVPIVAVGGTVALVLLDEERGEGRTPVDLPGIVLSVLGFGGLLLALSLIGGEGDAPVVSIVVSAVVGVGALAWFVVHGLRAEHPLLRLRLFGRRDFALASAANVFGQTAFFGLPFLIPLDSQVRGAAGALEAGMLMLSMAVASGVSGILGGRLIDRYGPRLPLLGGFVLLAVSCAALVGVGADGSPLGISVLCLAGLGAGLMPPAIQVAAMGSLPRPEVSRATSLLQVLQRTAQAMGTALLATIVSVAGFGAAYLTATGAAVLAAVLTSALRSRR
jgi:EmrB/QacA subfamily drug resistance transporter